MASMARSEESGVLWMNKSVALAKADLQEWNASLHSEDQINSVDD